MFKFSLSILVSMLLSASAWAASPEDEDFYWKKLLHFHGGKSAVVSEEFFLSPKGKHDAMEEESVAIKMLNGVHGQEIACNFPARYTWLKSVKKPVPEFDFNTCADLQNFLAGFLKERLSIVFVSEFSDAPASAFGHIMLMFQDTKLPEELADTISYSAITKAEPFMSYAYRGLTGKYDGYFIRAPYFKKKNEYTVSEQRALHRYALNLTQEEIFRIVLHLYELRKATFHYYFIKQNCAYQVGELLNVAFTHEDRGFDQANKVLPIDVVRRYEDIISTRTVEVPSLLKAEQLLSTLSTQERESVADVISNDAKPIVGLSEKVKEVLALDYQYAFRRRHVVLHHYEEVQSLKYKSSADSVELADPLYSRDSSRAMIGMMHRGSSDAVLLGYRPMLRDIYSLQQHALQESELSLLDATLASKRNNYTRFEHLDIFKLRSLPKRNILRSDVSWSFYVGANRYNKKENFLVEVEGGLGMSGGGKRYTATLMCSPGVQSGQGLHPYLKPDIGLFGYLTESMKLGLQSSVKIFKSSSYTTSELFLSADMGERTNGILRYMHSPSAPNRLMLEINLPI